jgi:hypothetical protein
MVSHLYAPSATVLSTACAGGTQQDRTTGLTSTSRYQSRRLLDDLGGLGEHAGGDGEAQRLRRPEADDGDGREGRR